MATVLSRLLIALRTERHMTVSQVLDLARQDGYTGEITLHLAQGKPKRVEISNPLQAQIIEENSKGLDKHP